MTDQVNVLRVGTQVVVRLSGAIDDSLAPRLRAALREIDEVVLHAVVADCTSVDQISGAGLVFLQDAQLRWRLRLLNPPAGLRRRLEQGS